MGKEEKRLGLLSNPQFLRYIAGLPTQTFKALMVVREGEGKAKTVISTQTGESPPQSEVVSEE